MERKKGKAEIMSANNDIMNPHASPQTDVAIPAAIPAAVPAAEPVERARFVLHLHDRDPDDDDDDDNNDGIRDDDDGGGGATDDCPASPRSFDSSEIFEDVLGEEGDDRRRTSDDLDLEGLLCPPPHRQPPPPTTRRPFPIGGLETEDRRLGDDDGDDGDDGDGRRKGRKRSSCPCRTNAVRRGPCRRALAAAFAGNADGSPPPATTTEARVGNMIVVFPGCFDDGWGLGIIGPHW